MGCEGEAGGKKTVGPPVGKTERGRRNQASKIARQATPRFKTYCLAIDSQVQSSLSSGRLEWVRPRKRPYKGEVYIVTVKIAE